jgi:hypothetical protein
MWTLIFQGRAHSLLATVKGSLLLGDSVVIASLVEHPLSLAAAKETINNYWHRCSALRSDRFREHCSINGYWFAKHRCSALRSDRSKENESYARRARRRIVVACVFGRVRANQCASSVQSREVAKGAHFTACQLTIPRRVSRCQQSQFCLLKGRLPVTVLSVCVK